MIICMEIDSILEILKPREIDVFLPSFFFVLEEGVIICMEINSILEILKFYLEKLAFSSSFSFLSSREKYRDLYGDRFDLGNYFRILYFILC